jgi:hypothetical protein
MKHNTLLLWTPRILAILVTLYLALFALDSFRFDRPVGAVVEDIAWHLTPAGIALLLLAVSWRWPWIGGIAFLVMAVGYATMVDFRFDWVVAISGPLLVVGTLFLWSWWAQRRSPAV